MDKKMEASVIGLGFRGYIGDDGKEKGSYYNGLYRSIYVINGSID